MTLVSVKVLDFSRTFLKNSVANSSYISIVLYLDAINNSHCFHNCNFIVNYCKHLNQRLCLQMILTIAIISYIIVKLFLPIANTPESEIALAGDRY